MLFGETGGRARRAGMEQKVARGVLALTRVARLASLARLAVF